MLGLLRRLLSRTDQDMPGGQRIICGLGNPGPRYAKTRHNVGYEVVVRLAGANRGDWLTYRHLARLCSLEINGVPVLLVQPLTFMNLSGSALRPLAKKRGLKPSSLLVVCDDLDLPFGALRLRARGSAGGHRGLQSIIDHLQTQDFPRLRIGIGRPLTGGDEANYVLSPFTREEQDLLEGILDQAAAAARVWATEGIEVAMNRFNRRREDLGST
ncbi:MAG: aminoacyl-tRNA hydrolase [Bacillota bacterium]|jgi:PTH1 family peptidyl-tRNA hydrolase|nr:aminoacyl-tRNA hydrolase [Bacillota bacterium]